MRIEMSMRSLVSVCSAQPELVKAAKGLAHGNRKEKLFLRGISARLAEQGYTTGTGKPFSAEQVKRLLTA